MCLSVMPAHAQLDVQTPLLSSPPANTGASDNRPANAAPASLSTGSALDGSLPFLPQGMNETVVTVPVGAPAANIGLETTIFRPDGPGPFPVVIFNHGKDRGDPQQQVRSRPISFAREFLRHGYMVIAPNREGFSRSGGTYDEQLCAITENGIEQARDIAATVRYVDQLHDADASHIVIAGASQGGLATLAYGIHPAPGVRGLINFSGGLRQDSCTTWQDAMNEAFQDFGQYSRIPTLWYYGDNDSYWPQTLARRLLATYQAAGGQATMIDFGTYKDNAHRLVGDRDAIPIWWPGTQRFLKQIGMPVAVRYRERSPEMPPPSHFAPVDAVNAVPYLSAEGRAGYEDFLHLYPSRAFAISSSGAWAWAEGGDEPASKALDKCQLSSRDPCRLYAVDNNVVWTGH